MVHLGNCAMAAHHLAAVCTQNTRHPQMQRLTATATLTHTQPQSYFY